MYVTGIIGKTYNKYIDFRFLSTTTTVLTVLLFLPEVERRACVQATKCHSRGHPKMWSRAGRMPIEVMGGPSKPIACPIQITSTTAIFPTMER